MQAKPNRLTWTRIPSPVGDYCDGYQAKGIDGLRIMRHHVDDRAYDGGRVATYWDLWAHGTALDQYPALADAKRAAGKLWREATDHVTPALQRMNMVPKPYRPRCNFGRSHIWIMPPGAADEQSYCCECGSVSSAYPFSTEG